MTGVVILAAGSSSRLGQPKQNLIYGGQTLLQRAVETALSLACGPVLVILGANEAVISPTLKTYAIAQCCNKYWEEGMASSIRLGITGLLKIEPAASGVLLMLCDQPFANVELLTKIVQTNAGHGITAAAYNDTTGVPVYFERSFFDVLLMLEGKEGAKKLLSEYKTMVAAVPFPLGAVDIDTIEDYMKLKEI